MGIPRYRAVPLPARSFAHASCQVVRLAGRLEPSRSVEVALVYYEALEYDADGSNARVGHCSHVRCR